MTTFIPSDGCTLQECDYPFFGVKCPVPSLIRPCSNTSWCRGRMYFHKPTIYVTGQCQCNTCTRLHAATMLETVAGLLALLKDKV